MAPKKAKNQSTKGEKQQDFTHLSQPAPAPKAEAVTVISEVVEELTEEELADRHRLELKVENAFVQTGSALRELRDRRLYRSTHKTFEEYCQDRFSFTRRSVDYLIAASDVVENLKMRTIGSQILPTNERQVRPLTNLEPDEQRQLWEQAVEAAGGKVPSGRTVKGIVERLKEKPVLQLSITYKRGDAFTLQRLIGAEHRYNRCWAITREIHEFSLKVETHDAMLLVKPENFDLIDERAVQHQLTALLKRIQRLRRHKLDRNALVLLESFGKQLYLTELEKKPGRTHLVNKKA